MPTSTTLGTPETMEGQGHAGVEELQAPETLERHGDEDGTEEPEAPTTLEGRGDAGVVEELEVPELPDEVLQRIFALLDDPAHLLQCSAVSRSWHRAVSHEHVFETLYRLRWGAMEKAPPAPPAAAAAAADADAVDAPTTDAPADEIAWLGLDGGGGWRKAAMFRGREELSVVGILDDMVWPTRRPLARARLRGLANAHVARFAIKHRVGWRGAKLLSRGYHAAGALLHLAEWEVCDGLAEIAADGTEAADIAGIAVATTPERNAQLCERGKAWQILLATS